jgi:predicted RNA-binding protein YlxR (DUF448 family)
MSAVMQPKLVSLNDWAEMTFGEKKPHVNTLRNWVNNGRISPRPQKIGRGWYVKPNAEYRED